MCGIVGVVAEEGVRADRLSAMSARLLHRGPDDCGVWLSPGAAPQVGLAHRRLSIVDLSPLGRNPMVRDGGRLCITFNGEVYNFLELRKELEGLGDRFVSRSDTEVVLASWDRWGTDCLRRFVGMFAFGIWDARSRRLFLARDRLGKKPLYYAEYAGRFAFASELKAFLAEPEFPRELDQDALGLYLRYGYVPSPFTIFRAARKLPPAHLARYEPGRAGLRIERYWDPLTVAAEPVRELDDGEAEKQLESLLKDAVRLRMIADVPLGAFLSGGIDSSLVVALMQEQSARPVKTFSIRFENPEFNEADHAAAVARHLGTEHREETCSMTAMRDVLDVLGETFDEPFADSSFIPTYIVARMTRRYVTVALSGDGGDELFFGYQRYAALERARWLLESPGPFRRTVARAIGLVPVRRARRVAEVLRQDGSDPYDRFVSWFPAAEAAALLGHASPHYPTYESTLAAVSSRQPADRASLLDLVTYLPEDILTKVDRASMAVGLEARAPLLDHRVAEFALRLPLSLKYRRGTTKWLLRRLLYRRVPRHLLDRPKMGFGVPLADWFRGPLRDRMEQYLSGPSLEDLGLTPGPARTLWRSFLDGRDPRTAPLWALFALCLWAERWNGPQKAPVRQSSGDSSKIA